MQPNTFNYFNGGKAPKLQPDEHMSPVRFHVRNVAAAISVSNQLMHHDAVTTLVDCKTAVKASIESFEHIMALFQAMESEIINLRHYVKVTKASHDKMMEARLYLESNCKQAPI